MIIKLLFIILLLLILKLFIVKFDLFDYFNVTLSLLFLLFSYIFVMKGGVLITFFLLILLIILIIYSFYHTDNYDSSVIVINGHINLHNMIKNKYSLISLFRDLKKNKVSFFNQDLCALLVNKKLVFYYKNDFYNKPVSIILDGKICYNELFFIGKGPKWLNKIILDNNTNIKDIIYSFYFNNKIYIIKK